LWQMPTPTQQALGGMLCAAQSTVLVEGQKFPDNYVQPIITADFTERIQMLIERVLSPSRLRPLIQALNLVKSEDEAKLISDIQQNVTVAPLITPMTAAGQADVSVGKKETSATDEPVAGFTVTYTDSDPVRSQKICNALTSLILDENLRSRAEFAQGTTDFLSRQADYAKSGLVEMDAQLLALSKSRSRSPEDEAKYKVLAVEYDVAEAFYKELLAKKNAAELSSSMENQQQGEQLQIADAANLPEAPYFPNRLLFALWGLAAGLLLGIGRLLWPAARKPFQRLAALFPTGTEIEAVEKSSL
jgi:uncharacterized protein involved in exopolysaccharide biosynthesis